jgi:ketosteroid isomerase-like protein
MEREENDNVGLVRRGYAALNRGDVDGVLELLDPAVVIGLLEDSPISEEFRGHDGFRKLLAENDETLADYRNIPEEIVEVSTDKIVVIVRSEGRGRISGAEVGGRIAHLLTIRDGKAVGFEVFPTREAAFRAAAAG